MTTTDGGARPHLGELVSEVQYRVADPHLHRHQPAIAVGIRSTSSAPNASR